MHSFAIRWIMNDLAWASSLFDKLSASGKPMVLKTTDGVVVDVRIVSLYSSSKSKHISLCFWTSLRCGILIRVLTLLPQGKKDVSDPSLSLGARVDEPHRSMEGSLDPLRIQSPALVTGSIILSAATSPLVELAQPSCLGQLMRLRSRS